MEANSWKRMFDRTASLLGIDVDTKYDADPSFFVVPANIFSKSSIGRVATMESQPTSPQLIFSLPVQPESSESEDESTSMDDENMPVELTQGSVEGASFLASLRSLVRDFFLILLRSSITSSMLGARWVVNACCLLGCVGKTDHV